MTSVSATDRRAFDLAIEIARRDKLQCRRIDEQLAAGYDYVEIGKSAARFCQSQALRLEPWQSPPCHADMRALDEPYGDPSGRRESAELALRMQRQGVSRWHPDPARECECIEVRGS
ncbi:hypothetical protein RX327_35105 [Bradyrhizobium sp. BEA-2-5]|uniref:hypothetical protein n=1 Tax=Bradyrhizobium sp. BEA-2-5 TaxID=3080015 RepID=UPI00293E8CF2|nr:hypothetical protein [Bradyrhizobium sp. BEA-2-5]WOH80914.1 hypothetical protein RX327_35105 [Bradyrhizobium sp. BEA-2-5]